MPLSVQDIFDVPYYSTSMRFSLEPAYSAIVNLMLLTRAEEFPGASEWLGATNQKLTRSERKTNALVMWGLHYVVAPEESWSSFPAYIDHLEGANPETLRDKMLDMYEQVQPCEDAEQGPPIDRAEALTSEELYLAYLRRRFGPGSVDEEIERKTFRLIIDPPEMQQVIVRHLRLMWEKYLAEEWNRNLPMLQEAVRAFQRLDMRGLPFREAAEQVVGKELAGEKWDKLFAETKRLIFVPHAQIGPYLMKMLTSTGELRIFYGPRLPKGSVMDAPDLSRTEIVMRLSALADDTRLRILRMVAESGELRSQEIMEALNLSQSAASRHLTQLSATGYLVERRCDGAKCYAVNPERIADTMQAVTNFLLVRERIGI